MDNWNESTSQDRVHDKYAEALERYHTRLIDDDIRKQVTALLDKHLEENNTVEVRKRLLHCVDLTTLKCTDSEDSVMRFTQKVNDFETAWPGLDNVAAICVYPNMAGIVSDTLEADHVNIACVSAGFPHSQTFMEVKVAETALALKSGADEIDIVMPVGKFLNGDYEGRADAIGELTEVCGEHTLKVILETGALGSAILGFAAVMGEKDRCAFAQKFVRTGKPILPDPEKVAIYEQKYATFKKLRTFVKDELCK